MVSKMKTRHGNRGIEPEKENNVGGIASYELAREQRIKENLERMHKLGIVELSRNLKPTKTSRPYKRKPPPSPKSQRRSSRYSICCLRILVPFEIGTGFKFLYM